MQDLMDHPRSTLKRIFTPERLLEMTGVPDAFDDVRIFCTPSVCCHGSSVLPYRAFRHISGGHGSCLPLRTTAFACHPRMKALLAGFESVNTGLCSLM